jgi:ATP-binding cassette subfamily B protein
MSFLVDSAQRAVAGSKDYFEVLAEERERAGGAGPQGRGAAAVAAGQPRADDDGGTDVRRGGAAPSRPAQPRADVVPAVRFDEVSFAYDPDASRPVLDRVSFEIPQGQRVALVGESGGGKSTIAHLLMGLYPVTGGRIAVFGQDVAELDLAELRERIAAVFQEPSLFSGTVRENIAYADPAASDERVRAAAEAAYAHRFVEAFDDGYEQVIGERGLRLSGGQKQRIAVARAVLKDAPILVLDEATSALDTKSERLVQGALEELMVGRSSLIVAHRLSTIASVDRIVTLRGGRVQEVGTPAELAESGGIYAQLLRLQKAGTKEARKMLKEYGLSG